jgi:hypothetical protein
MWRNGRIEAMTRGPVTRRLARAKSGCTRRAPPVPAYRPTPWHRLHRWPNGGERSIRGAHDCLPFGRSARLASPRAGNSIRPPASRNLIVIPSSRCKYRWMTGPTPGPASIEDTVDTRVPRLAHFYWGHHPGRFGIQRRAGGAAVARDGVGRDRSDHAMAPQRFEPRYRWRTDRRRASTFRSYRRDGVRPGPSPVYVGNVASGALQQTRCPRMPRNPCLPA